MPIFDVKVRFVFEGTFRIRGTSVSEVRENASKNCGMTVGNISSTLDSNDVDWDFSYHPEKHIGRIKRVQN